MPQTNSSSSFWLRESQEKANQVQQLLLSSSNNNSGKDVDQVMNRDVVIIGAGISGCSIAYWIRKLFPDRNVTVLDAKGICQGATGRNGGHIWPGLVDGFKDGVSQLGAKVAKDIWDFTIKNTEAVKRYVSEHESASDCELRFPGSVYLATSEEEWVALQEEYELMVTQSGIQNVELWDQERCRMETHSTKFRGGLYTVDAGQLWPAKLVLSISQEAIRLGAEFLCYTKVQSVEEKDQMEIITDRGIIMANQVVYATNAYTSEILPFAKDKITPVRGQVIITEPMPSQFWRFGLSCNEGYEYFMQRPDHRIVLGGFRWMSPTLELNTTDDSTLNSFVSQGLTSFLSDYFPSIIPDQVNIEHEWTGIMGFSSDRLPLVGPVPDRQKSVTGISSREFICAGFTGHGMPMTFLCGKAVAQMIGGVEPEVFVESFLPSRFIESLTQ